jgi:hypothetical protein
MSSRFTAKELSNIPWRDVRSMYHPVDIGEYICRSAELRYNERLAHVIQSGLSNPTRAEANMARRCEAAIRRHYYNVYLPYCEEQQAQSGLTGEERIALGREQGHW